MANDIHDDNLILNYINSIQTVKTGEQLLIDNNPNVIASDVVPNENLVVNDDGAVLWNRDANNNYSMTTVKMDSKAKETNVKFETTPLNSSEEAMKAKNNIDVCQQFGKQISQLFNDHGTCDEHDKLNRCEMTEKENLNKNQSNLNVDVSAVFNNKQPSEYTTKGNSQIGKPVLITEDYIKDKLIVYNDESAEKTNSYEKTNLNLYDLTDCIRKSYFAMKNCQAVSLSPYPYSEIVTSIGKAVHEIIQKRLPFNSCEQVMKIDDFDIPISCRMDAMWNDGVVVEIKTTDAIPKQIKRQHLQQGLLYCYFLNKFYNENIHTLQFIYVCRGKVSVKVFNVNFTQELFNESEKYVMSYISDLKKHLVSDMVFSMNHPFVNKTNCDFCNYKTHCMKGTAKFESLGGK